MKTTQMKQVLGLCALLAMGVGSTAFAHGKGGVHVMGVVKAVTADAITVETTDKKTVSIMTTADTKVMRGKAEAKLNDIQVGERAVVHAMKHEDHLMAELIKLGDSPSGDAKPPAKGSAPAETHEGHTP